MFFFLWRSAFCIPDDMITFSVSVVFYLWYYSLGSYQSQGWAWSGGLQASISAISIIWFDMQKRVLKKNMRYLRIKTHFWEYLWGSITLQLSIPQGSVGDQKRLTCIISRVDIDAIECRGVHVLFCWLLLLMFLSGQKSWHTLKWMLSCFFLTDKPGPPGKPETDDIQSQSVRVTWNSSSEMNNSPVTEYILSAR